MNKKRNTNKNKQKNIFISIYNAFKNFGNAIPIFLGIILLLGLLRTYVIPQLVSSIFKGEMLSDTILGSIFGSVSAGNAVTSYIIGGELLKQGISLFAVTAFIIAWVTVGIVQLPAEAAFLGKRFAIYRNILSFILSVVLSIGIVLVFRIFQ